jgi:hypothetical protein
LASGAADEGKADKHGRPGSGLGNAADTERASADRTRDAKNFRNAAKTSRTAGDRTSDADSLRSGVRARDVRADGRRADRRPYVSRTAAVLRLAKRAVE